MSGSTLDRPRGWRRAWRRLASSTAERDAGDMIETALQSGCTLIAEAPLGPTVSVRGRLTSTSLRPRGGVPALEVDLFDGSGTLVVVWLGRRRIVGIDPGQRLQVQGRIHLRRGVKVMVNPSYELLP